MTILEKRDCILRGTAYNKTGKEQDMTDAQKHDLKTKIEDKVKKKLVRIEMTRNSERMNKKEGERNNAPTCAKTDDKSFKSKTTEENNIGKKERKSKSTKEFCIESTLHLTTELSLFTYCSS